MYGYPRDLNIDGIIGNELNQICLGCWDIQFVFSGSGISRICSQGKVQFFEAAVLICEWEAGRFSSLDFERFLAVVPVSYSLPNDRTLEICFEAGLSFRLLDDSDQYETAQIYFEDPTKGAIII
jgi:hypothetical protein